MHVRYRPLRGLRRSDAMADAPVVPSLSQLATEYIDRVVNRRDITAFEEMVADDYRGTGPRWPATREELRRFYETQQVERPDWRIDIREVVELGDSVVVRAHACGAVATGTSTVHAEVDWLAHYRFRNSQIIEINVLSVVDGSSG